MVEKYNPIEYMHRVLSIGDRDRELDYIMYDSKVNEDYDFILKNAGAHDGTLIFTYEIIEGIFIPLINRQYVKGGIFTEEELANIKDVKYTLGDLTIEKE